MQAALNGFISTLTKADQISLLKDARKIYLHAGDVLSSTIQTSSKIYFPTRGSIVLFLGQTDDAKGSHHGLAIGLIGAEGAAGLQLALGFGHLPFQLLVQSSGEAYVVDATDAQKLVQRRPIVLFKFSQYLWHLYTDIANFAVNAYNTDIQIRLAKWLIISAQLCAPEPLRLTHLHMAKMLGVRRSSISIAARDLKLKRYINYKRGLITLTNLPALQKLAAG